MGNLNVDLATTNFSGSIFACCTQMPFMYIKIQKGSGGGGGGEGDIGRVVVVV